MSCRHGGFHTLRHNEIRDLLARLFREVCNDVTIKSYLQPLTGEQFPASTNKSDEARLDIRARRFWGTGRGQQDAFFISGCLNPSHCPTGTPVFPFCTASTSHRKGSTTDSEFKKLSADASLHSFSPLEAAWHSLPEAIGQHAERQA